MDERTEALNDLIIAAAEDAQREGHGVDAIGEAFLAAALAALEHHEGPRATGRRLHLLAERFTAWAGAAM